jgi:hypothetical protein
MGGPLGFIGPAAQLAGSAGGKGGGGGGGGGGGQGGLTPQEAALINYEREQKQLQAKSEFAKSGTGASTMATQAVGGPNIWAALKASGISDKNQQVQGAGLQDIAKQQATLAGLADSQRGGGQGNLVDQGAGTGTGTGTSGATDATA